MYNEEKLYPALLQGRSQAMVLACLNIPQVLAPNILLEPVSVKEVNL